MLFDVFDVIQEWWVRCCTNVAGCHLPSSIPATHRSKPYVERTFVNMWVHVVS